MWLLATATGVAWALFIYLFIEQLSVIKIKYCWIVRLLVSSELERIWKETLVAVNSVVPHCSWPGQKEENNEKCQSQ